MSLYDQIADNFRTWEFRGRGALTYPGPVALEPPFLPFPGHKIKYGGSATDGSKPTFLSKLAGKVIHSIYPPDYAVSDLSITPADHSMPEILEDEEELPVEFLLLLPPTLSASIESMGHFFGSLGFSYSPLSFEIIGNSDQSWMQFSARRHDVELVSAQLMAQFPDARVEWSQSNLAHTWFDGSDDERIVIDFALFREFMLPLHAPPRLDALVSLIGGLEILQADEVAIYQILFEPLVAPWGEEALRSVTKEGGKSFFEDGAALVKGATEKASSPLYAVVIRLASKAADFPRAWQIIRSMSCALRLFSREGGQSLTPLSNREYDQYSHCEDVVLRRSRRPGMILSLPELVELVHLPSPAVKSPRFMRFIEDRSRPTPAPKEPADTPGTLILGINERADEQIPVVCSPKARPQHTHIIGASGTGKSSLLFSMIMQDLESGQGIAILDPHGDLITRILCNMPESRLDDVVLFDPADADAITPFNVLSAHSDFERTLLASDLVGVFRDFSTSWGDRMTVVFRYLVLAFLEHQDGGTFAQMQTFLIDKAWRERFLKGVKDADVVRYWTDVFPNFDGSKSTGPILSRIDTLVSHKIINHMVNQRENKIDFAKVMDEGRILLVNLPTGLLGEDVALMLGGFIMVKLNQMAMSRARMEAEDRRPFFCYIDECQHFVTSSIANILTGARKYGLGLILAHQHLQQLRSKADVAAAVMANTATRIAFRVGDADARILAGDYAH